MDEHIDEITAAADAYRAAQERVAAARRRLQQALRSAYGAGARTDLMQQAAGLTRPTFYRLLGGVRN